MSSGFQQKKEKLEDKILVELQNYSSLTQNFFKHKNYLFYE